MRNDNGFSIQAKEIHYNIIINEDKIGEGRITHDVLLPKKAISTLENEAEVYINSLSNNYDYIIKSKDSIPIGIDITANVSMFHIKVSDKLTYYLNTNELINNLLKSKAINNSFKIKKVKLLSGNLQESNLEITFEIINRFSVALTVQDIDIDILSDKKIGKKLGDWQLKEAYQIKPKQSVTLPAHVTVQNMNAAGSLLLKALSKKMDFYLKGNATVILNNRKFVVPISQTIEL